MKIVGSRSHRCGSFEGGIREHLDGGVGDELEGPDDEDEDAHHVPVALGEGGGGEAGLGLELVGVNGGGEAELEEGQGQGDQGEDDEEEEDVVVVEEGVGDARGVAEPERLRSGEVATQRGRGLCGGGVGEHRGLAGARAHRRRRGMGEEGGGYFAERPLDCGRIVGRGRVLFMERWWLWPSF